MPIYVYSGSLTRPAPQYGAANGRGITQFSFDDAGGVLTPLGEARGIDDTAWLVIDAERRRLHATNEVSGSDQSALASFAIDAHGRLSLLGSQPLQGGEACHASFADHGRLLLVANYNGATPARLAGAVGQRAAARCRRCRWAPWRAASGSEATVRTRRGKPPHMPTA